MKQEPTLCENTSFRYLKEKDISNPHYQVACFFSNDENNLEAFRFGMIDLIKTACSNRFYGNRVHYYYSQQQFVKLLELAYVLNESQEDFKLSTGHPLYRLSDSPIESYTADKNSCFPALLFRTLSGTEVNDIRLFFEEFFQYKSLEGWRTTLDALLSCANGDITMDDFYHAKAYETVLIREYIEKMIEAIGLVCETKSLPYIKLHHARDFRVEVKEEVTGPQFNPLPLIQFTEKNFPAVVNFIAEVVGPEKIYCLNHRTDHEGKDHANLILVIPEKYPQTFAEVETILEFALLKHSHLSCTLFKSSFFHNMVSEGHVYFSMVCNDENLVYDDGSTPLPTLRLDNRSEKIEKTKCEFYTGLAKAKTFYAVAQTYRNDNVIMSAFMLHQATELCLRSLNRSLSTQDKTTHSIKALLKFNLRLTTKLSLLMDNGSAEDERLLTVFEGAYLGYRYTEKYHIDVQDLNILFERVKNLHVAAEEIFVNWMDNFECLINKAKNDQ